MLESSKRMSNFYDRLLGGDLRSIGAADAIAHEATHDPTIVPALVAGLYLDVPVVRMRCADALEKASRANAACLAPYAQQLLALLEPTQPKELLWHLLHMCPRVHWEATQLPRTFAAVDACLAHSSSIVKTNAMQALCELIPQAPERTGEVIQRIAELARTGTPAMRARGAKLLHVLAH